MTMVFVGNHYEVTGGAATKFYFAGASRVAMRQNGTLFFLLSDHLGSTSLTTDANGVKVGGLRYNAWGAVRYADGARLLQDLRSEHEMVEMKKHGARS